MPPERRSLTPPYFAQWESPRLVRAFLAGRGAETDPRWAGSGAESRAEYAHWADHLCGMACLKMALAARGRHWTIHSLRRAVQRHGGYAETAQGIRGLIYAGAVEWLQEQGIAADIRVDLTAGGLPPLLAGHLIIASVHPAIRRPEGAAPGRGGHLVLVFGTDRQGRLRFHNPSGDSVATQRDVRLSPGEFGRFFAGRGMLLPRSHACAAHRPAAAER